MIYNFRIDRSARNQILGRLSCLNDGVEAGDAWAAHGEISEHK